jgi:selenide,water dikinase
MGGKPLSALNIVGFPKDLFPIEVLTAILQGGQDKCAEAAP